MGIHETAPTPRIQTRPPFKVDTRERTGVPGDYTIRPGSRDVRHAEADNYASFGPRTGRLVATGTVRIGTSPRGRRRTPGEGRLSDAFSPSGIASQEPRLITSVHAPIEVMGMRMHVLAAPGPV